MDVEILLCILGILIICIAMSMDNEHVYQQHKVIGDIGEDIVSKKLESLSEDFVVENSIRIRNSQIDHLVINHNLGVVFVIETKLWGGIITGSYNDSKWIQNKNGELKYFDNPIAQNRFHCNDVRREYKDYKIYNVVVFVRNNNVPSSKCIVKVNELLDFINRECNRQLNAS
jgi:hypothetical protein